MKTVVIAGCATLLFASYRPFGSTIKEIFVKQFYTIEQPITFTGNLWEMIAALKQGQRVDRFKHADNLHHEIYWFHRRDAFFGHMLQTPLLQSACQAQGLLQLRLSRQRIQRQANAAW